MTRATVTDMRPIRPAAEVARARMRAFAVTPRERLELLRRDEARRARRAG